jgi:hypothetical protein
MKKLLAILAILGLLFAGCSPDPDAEYSVVYLSNGTPNGYAPTDPKKYKINDVAEVLGKHTLDKPGSTSFCWDTKSDGSGDSYNEGNTIIINIPRRRAAGYVVLVRYLSQV